MSVEKPASPSPSAVRAWIALARAQKRLLAVIERDLKAAKLPPLGWYDVLLELSRAEGGRLRPFEIEEKILLAQYNLSRLLDRLEREGLVRREAFDDDGRGRWVVITAAGRAMQRRMWSTYSRSLQDLIGATLDDASTDLLASLLARLSKAELGSKG